MKIPNKVFVKQNHIYYVNKHQIFRSYRLLHNFMLVLVDGDVIFWFSAIIHLTLKKESSIIILLLPYCEVVLWCP